MSGRKPLVAAVLVTVASLLAVASGADASSLGRAQAAPCGGLLQPQCPPPPEQPPPAQDPPPQQETPPATLTLHPSATDVLLRGESPRRIVLRGTVSGAAPGSPVHVVLEGSAPAYGKSVASRSTHTDGAGRFTFAVRPNINTTYRAVVAPGEAVQGASEPVAVRVYSGVGVSLYGLTRRTVDFLIEANGPDVLHFADGSLRPLPGPARYGYVYVVPRHSSRAYRVGRAKLEDGGCGTFCTRSAWVYKVPITRRLRRSRGLIGCTRGLAWLGSGLPTPACGRRTVRLR